MEAKQIAAGLLQAMQAEADGHNFYMMAAKNTQDPKGQEVFAAMAQEELEHLRFLKKQYQSFLDNEKPDPNVKLPTSPNISPDSPIFSDNIKSRLHQAHYEMSALSIAIQLELSSINYYRQQAEQIADQTIKAFYQELAEWESRHYQMLLNQQQALKEDYWAGGGFAPF